MSNLLSQASLVMIPSGYKEDVVYSQIPTSGAGDLSFTRASNGTRINSAGLVEVCPWNLVEQSETFDNVYWAKQNGITATANTATAPNGTTTADTLEKTGGSGGMNYYYIVQSVNTFEQLTNFFYVKYKSGSGIVWLLGKNSGTFAFYDVINGAALSKSSGMTTSIESVGNGWYKCIFSQTYVGATSTEFGIGVCLADGTPNYNATTAATQSVYIWGAQSSISSTAKPYFPTTDRLNVPRLTYQNGGGGCPSLLLEKQSTNYARNWDFNAAIWDKNIVSVVANSATSPDGTNNAFLIYPTSSGTDRFLYDNQGSASYTANANYTTTVYAKAAGLNWAYIRFEDKTNTSSFTYFNLATGTVGSTTGSGTVISTSIESMGNGWYRLRVTANMSSGSGGKNNVLFGVADGNASSSATTSGTNGVLFYGPQSEQSDYPTSPIFTSGSSATRVADTCSKTGISSLIGQTEGTIFCDVNLKVRTAFSYFAINYGGSSSQYIGIYFRTNGIELEVVDTTLQSSIVLANTSTGRFKIAAAYKANDVALYINGVQVGTDTSANIPACDKLDLFAYAQEQPLEYNQAILFKTRLTNAELASITTI